MSLGDRFDALLGAARAGDEAALGELYRDLSPMVLGYLRGRGARDPEDLTSDTFVAVVRHLARFQGDETRLRSWVLTIAHRRLIDERRRAGRRPEDLVEGDSLLRIAGRAPGDAESAALARLSHAEAMDLLDELTDDQRAVVVLRLVADLPVEEVARVLGKRPGAVKTLQRRALARLSRVLEHRRIVNTRPERKKGDIAATEPFPEQGFLR